MTAQPGLDCRRNRRFHEPLGLHTEHSDRAETPLPAVPRECIQNQPVKGEYFLPFVVDELLQEKKAEVTVLRSYDNWYGVTYKEDKENVMAALQKLKDEGRYPQKLWEE